MSRKTPNRYFYIDGVNQEERLRHLLKLLDIEVGYDSLKNIADTAIQKKIPPCDYIEAFLKAVIALKEEGRRELWIKQAKFKALKTLEDFDLLFQPSINEVQIQELATSRFIEKGQNIIILGPSGVGKKHLATSLGIKAIENGFRTKFFRIDELVGDFQKISNIDTSQRFLRNLIKQKLLILGDIGLHSRIDENGSAFLYKLITKRYEEKATTIFTSVELFDKWDLFGSPRRTEDALDKIMEHAVIINITGDSYRKKNNPKELESLS
ncbi:MAG: ATP-binding protein [Patescibacteria group bacterium]